MCTQATHKYTLTHTDLCIFTSTDSHIHRHIQVYEDYSCTHQDTHTPMYTGAPDILEHPPWAPRRATPPGSLSHSLSLSRPRALCPLNPVCSLSFLLLQALILPGAQSGMKLRAGTLFCLSDPRTEKMEEAGRPGAGEPAREPPGCTRPDLGPMPLRERGSSLLRPWPLQGGEGGWGQERGRRMEGIEEDSLP